MSNLLFPAPEPTTITIQNSDQVFPVRRVYCIGRNYADHAIEMGHDPDKEPPFFFQKNTDNINTSGQFPYPSMSQDVHFEMELVIALEKGGKNIPLDAALNHVYGYALGLDMTRRDLQAQMKKMGRPWEIGKAFEQSAPVSPIYPASKIGHPQQGSISLRVNDEVRQQGDLNQMIWKTAEMISYLSNYYELAPGDLIMTGTPAGVGAIQVGDKLTGEIENLGKFEVDVV
ncbi:5-carboxymethyl-2-hydroxymuconate isomerase [Marinomonas sp. SBI22]|uniref:fumarylacetoacetate hydrolase family protein n=1 Tax=unclassified Marinomonas TaxID=196814 RepID=UPI0007AF5C67|nr:MULTISPECIES: fumarylacetoacetate hydrolase family protein [unclassified Marinomonas]KZM44119.1 5-carboxymethyl-2-hydroxymuconate isomerase [Marinomonas sp. SBI22]KZM45278.1 5-carboxymethyl-2-hydroxymuconate isomerase [Marinomonas sp. SBI8L]